MKEEREVGESTTSRFIRQRTHIEVEVPARLFTLVDLRAGLWDIPVGDMLILYALLGAHVQYGIDGNKHAQARIQAEMERLITMHGYAVEELLKLSKWSPG
jgi:hypothetical protein